MNLIKTYIIPRLFTDIVFFYLLLILLGLVAAGLPFDLNFLLGAVANYLMLIFAFIINDIEDREDDAGAVFIPQTWQDNIRMMLGMHVNGSGVPGAKRFLNPFSHGDLSVTVGYLWCGILALIGFIFSFLAGGYWPLVIATLNIVVGVLYSWQKVRLKSIPILDLLSHAFLLAGAQVVYFLAYPRANHAWLGWALAALVFLNSVSGDLRNEYRDFDEDRQAGIRNTASVIGKRNAYIFGQLLNVISIVMIMILLVGRGFNLVGNNS
ncbi:UbiA family prenyltransferase [Candidatus Dojkabacteria bacterium]|uniref:UbiA family prenyltransferase n=1 Tax=Candidatus Dojkabacteria bacterium TaxID=2099670 RepID=A0A955I808_9BACT|nr:UbiA family prenyltransferase [Candidatus Dojkabacteria bacterium]